jgi:hypothetical protein
MVIVSAISVKKIHSRTHTVTHNSVGEGEALIISMPGKKLLERRSGLCPSKK